MKFSEDFDKYARDVLRINNPFKDQFKRLEKTFFETENGTIIADTKELEKIDKETRVSREEWIKLRDRYVAERILRELGYEVLSTSSYFKYYPDAIPCEGSSGQCTIECRMRGCKYE